MLAEFFDLHRLLQVFANATFGETVRPRLPTLLLTSHEYSTHLALKKSLTFQLKKATDAMKHEKTTYATLSDYILSKLQEQLVAGPTEFSVFSIWDWFVLGFCMVTVVNVCLTVHTKFHVRTLFFLLSKKGVDGRILDSGIFDYQATTDRTFRSDDNPNLNTLWHQILNHYVSDECLLVFVVFLLTIMVVILVRLLYYKQRKCNATLLFIEIVTEATTLKVLYRCLPYPPNFYKIVITRLNSSVAYYGTWFGFGKLILDIQNVSVLDVITQDNISESVSNKPWMVTKLYPSILSGSYRMNLLVYNGRHDLVDVLPIRLNSELNCQVELARRNVQITDSADMPDPNAVQADV
jgi:hypothetical protein